MERNITSLIAQMTLEEKAGFCSGMDMWNTKPLARLNIPSVMMTDGPHGLRKQEGAGDHLGLNESVPAVCFPAACANASSFDPELIRQMGQTLGEESRSLDVALLLGPAVNIKRSPLCGRNFEYYSEDPYLAGQMATAFIQGVQQWDVGTSIKHFAANNQETNRMTNSSNLSERTLQEIYLPAFEEAIKTAKPWSVMCSYNQINGTFACEDPHLLTDILREQWGFDGFVVTDWGAMNERVDALKAGTELEMPSSGGITDAQIVAAVQAGELEEAVLDEAVARILGKLLLYVDSSKSVSSFDLSKAHQQAVEIEKESAVLLENNGILPLKAEQKVVYLGEFAKTPRYQGGGSSHIHSYHISNALDVALQKDRPVAYEKAFPFNRDVLDEKLLHLAVAAAKEADVAVVFAGLPDIIESEGYDRTHMQLPDCQNRLIEAVLAVQPNTVVVLHNGSPIVCPWAKKAAAVLEMYLGGEGVGEATDALLWGEANPSGRLAETFPLRLEDTPSYLNFANDAFNTDYTEGVFVGYRWYDSRKMEVLWPFGHGLSYTTFSYSNPRLDHQEMKDDSVISFQVDVTNTGAMEGKEVVQLYVKDCTHTAIRPEKELKGFAKVNLLPGETKTVRISINARSLSYYNETLKDWYAAPGQYEILAARSSRDIFAVLPLQFTTEKLLPLKVDKNTQLGVLMKDPRTAPLLHRIFGHDAWAKQVEEPKASEASTDPNDEVNKKLIEHTMAFMPLRSLRSFVHLSTEQLDGLIDAINQSLEAEK